MKFENAVEALITRIDRYASEPGTLDDKTYRLLTRLANKLSVLENRHKNWSSLQSPYHQPVKDDQFDIHVKNVREDTWEWIIYRNKAMLLKSNRFFTSDDAAEKDAVDNLPKADQKWRNLYGV